MKDWSTFFSELNPEVREISFDSRAYPLAMMSALISSLGRFARVRKVSISFEPKMNYSTGRKDDDKGNKTPAVEAAHLLQTLCAKRGVKFYCTFLAGVKPEDIF